MIKGSRNEKCDVWSTSIILYIMLSGEASFKGRDDEIFANILAKRYVTLIDTIQNVSATAKDLLRQMLTFNYAKRPSCSSTTISATSTAA